jgi:hypothetical protein
VWACWRMGVSACAGRCYRMGPMGLNGTYVPDSTSPTGVIRANRANNYPVQNAFAIQCHADTPIRRYAHTFPLLAPASRL